MKNMKLDLSKSNEWRYCTLVTKLALSNSDKAQGWVKPKAKLKGFDLGQFVIFLYAPKLSNEDTRESTGDIE